MQTHILLRPEMPLDTPMGRAHAFMLIDPGFDHDFQWSCFLRDEPHAGECWTFSNKDVRAVENITLGRPKAKPFPIMPEQTK